MMDIHTIPYLRTTLRKVVLPPGDSKKGEIAFLLTSNVDESISLINQTENCYLNNKYYFYFYPAKLIGSFSTGRRYNVNKVQYWSKLRERISKETTLHMYPDKFQLSPSNERNTVYDLSSYYELYEENCIKYPVFKRIEMFLTLMQPVLMGNYGKHKGSNGALKDKDKFVLINASSFRYLSSGKLVDRIKNPLYLIYLTLYKNPDWIKDLDIDFVAFMDNRVLRFNPAKIEKKEVPKLLAEIKKLYRNQEEEINIDAQISDETEEVKEEKPVVQANTTPEHIPEAKTGKVALKPLATGINQTKKLENMISPRNNLSVVVNNIDQPTPELKKKMNAVYADVKKEVAEEVKNAKEPESIDVKAEVAKKTEEAIDNDEELLSEIFNQMRKQSVPQKSQRSTARDELLREKQKDIVVKGLTLSDLAKVDAKHKEIEKNNIGDAMHANNPNMKEIQFQNFNDTYVKSVMPKDLVDVFTNLNNASIKMFIRDIKVEDSSNALNLKETWTVSLEDENRTRHTIKVDIPKFYDKNFLWLSGNKKSIKNQEFFLPVVKISEDTVMIVTNYNKLTIKRVETRNLREFTLINKYLIEHPEITQKYFKPGSCKIANKEYITALEYDQYAAKFVSFKTNRVKIFFNQKEAQLIAADKGVDLTKHKEEIFIGFEKNEPLFIGMDTQRDKNGRGISDIIIENLPDGAEEEIMKYPVPKRLMHTQITTMKQDQPMMVLMCLWEGLSTVLNKAQIKYRLETSRKNVKPNEDYMVFKNCVLVYDATVSTELLMNGLKVLDTKSYDISEFDTQTPYLSFIERKYGKLSILNALNNVYEFTIGGIEKEILINLGLPTDLIQLMVYANSLLGDSQFVGELNQSQYRVRCAEVIPAILYDCIAKAYVPFKNSNGKKKLSIPQDAVIKKLLELNTVEDTSTLNPFLELETTHGVSTKGWRGVNLEDSYTVPKRSYDKTMTGVIGVSSSPDGQVGVNRTLTMEPMVESARGYINVKDDKLDELKDVNLFSPAEMMIPLGATRDDPIRTGHSVKQSRATIPVKNASPVLISNGSDELCKYYLSSDFVVNADQDGVVIEKDPKSKIMIVEYKDGSHRAINLDKNLVKNGGGGFELSNTLVTNLEVGDKFKRNETLAWHDKFFKNIPTQGVRMNVGALIKVALYSSYNTYEDADFITEKVSDLCSTEMCFRVKVAIGKNSNVFNMVKVGDEIAVGDKLIEFDESFEESDINKLLESLGDNEELKEAIDSNSRNAKKSKYSGVVEEIKIYSASELEDLSPSLQKIVGDYYKRIDAKHRILNKYDKTPGIVKCGMLLTESSGKTEPDRYGNIRGIKVEDGVAIEFYIKHSEPLEVGSKVANFSPLKNIVSEVIPAGYEPFSEFRPEESVDSIISPSSILNRMVSSVLPTLFGNKLIIELKRRLKEIWDKNGEFAAKRKEMENLIYKFFSALDPTGDNTKKYKDMFSPMSEAKFKAFFNEFFSNPDHYLILEIVDYERDVHIEDIEKAAKVINVPLFEYVSFPHFTMDNEHPTVTKHKIPVGYIHLKRPQQTVMKKNGMSVTSEQRSAFTGQVTGADKNGRESDLENCMLTSLGMKKTLKELNGPRADDLVAKKEMLQSIATKGYVQLGELTDKLENKTTLNTINTYFLGMGLHTDLVTKGLQLPYTTDHE